MSKQLEKVFSTYGAPMGRPSHMEPENFQGKTRCFHVNLTDGYDEGGAYWGISEPIYCARNDNGLFMTVRANSRAAAKAALQANAKAIGQTIKWVN